MNVRQVIPKDAIPSIDDPTFEATYPWDETDRAIVVESEPARAYPLRILDYHEIANDRLDLEGGDTASIAVTWCPLCASAIVYDRRVGGRTLSFGVSGKLADDDLVMYDRETESEWKQSAGRAIGGPLAGTQLDILPATTTTIARFREGYPDGVILQPVPDAESEAAGSGDEPEPVEYGERPYAEYLSSDGFGLAAHRGDDGRSWERDDVDPTSVVLGVERDGEAVGVTLPTVADAGGTLEISVGSTDVLIVYADGLHAYDHPGGEAALDDSNGQLVVDGTTYDPVTGESDDGRSLERIPARRLFAFTWQDDHGPDAFYTG
ncbi:DUF3179 domain-containing (seleno)protein [Halovivax gelatinilyticus]|uniref:DUF3179 domain-containing (seleno)protein n=1 Tax=Halovivax gelatinilyticus TaxID=2961597 RepID=UPI0020CA9BD4|nr:DUF3179 domain-containing (seleno)protein [Halovivax gelatinilyticus]